MSVYVRPHQTVSEALDIAADLLSAAGIENPRFDAMQLLMWATRCSREELIRDPGRLMESGYINYSKVLNLRIQREPLPYITGVQWFYGRRFLVNRHVLIPRPETEMLVQFALEVRAEMIADIGTGSGCIAVSIAAENPTARVTAVDVSRSAVSIARRNARHNRVEAQMTFFVGDLLQPLAGQKFDLIVSNPPYIALVDVPGLMPEVKCEPEIALWKGAGEDGMELHRRLMIGARDLLKPGGWLALEVGYGQADSVSLFAEEYGYKSVNQRSDLGGIDRVVAARWG